MEDKIKKIIDSIRPDLQNDGGDIEFDSYKDNIVYVKISGMCMHCHMLQYTLEGVKQILKSEITEIKDVQLKD